MVDISQRSEMSRSGHLIQVWTARYLSDSSLLFVDTADLDAAKIDAAASAQGRRNISEKFNERLIKRVCRRAALRTLDLYAKNKGAEAPKMVDLVRFGLDIYPALLKFYQTHTPVMVSSQLMQQQADNKKINVFAIPEILVLAEILGPFLTVFRLRHGIDDADWQTRSFLTTQLGLSSGLLLETLSAAEQVILRPYFSFLEEFVAMPWHQVCDAATKHGPTSADLLVVERMLSKVSEISLTVYTQWSQLFGGYYNRRGQLDNPGVKHSSVRDFSMFQVYLWLCVLQGDLRAIEQELVVLANLVYKGIGIPWEMTVKGTKLLATEIISNLEPTERALVTPYTDGMVQLFMAQ
ncbi:MAG: hypothetical protein KTR27_22200 [Leptolyngbyaceae cyanobacterium MAG.088]|nr:hypothetical protein [Leptolyngbyaceae cyanobacterium MAG.088]